MTFSDNYLSPSTTSSGNYKDSFDAATITANKWGLQLILFKIEMVNLDADYADAGKIYVSILILRNV